MINIQNGNIDIDNINFTIKQKLTKDEFISSNLFADVLNNDEYGYTRYYIKPQIICGEKFAISLIFNPDGFLYMANIGIQSDDVISSWENWSESREMQKKEFHDKWLEKNIGQPPYSYTWGLMASSYDPRSGSSSINITYK